MRAVWLFLDGVKDKLSALADLAQLASVPITVLLWWFTREKLRSFWSRCGKIVRVLVIIVTLWVVVRLGWLRWLERLVILPLWAVLGLSAGPALLTIVGQRIYRRTEVLENRPTVPLPFLAHGVLWQMERGQF